jgi:hypothetical protein
MLGLVAIAITLTWNPAAATVQAPATQTGNTVTVKTN